MIDMTAVSSPEVDGLLLELTQPEGRADPYPRYQRLREIAPIARAADGVFVLTRFADCLAVLRNPHFGRSGPDVLYRSMGMPNWRDHVGISLMAGSMLFINPPDHTRLRRLVSQAFTPRRVEALRPVVTGIVDRLVEGLEGEADFVSAFAFRLPIAVIGDMLGIPSADQPSFQPLIRDWTMLLDRFDAEILQRADDAAAEIKTYLAEQVADRRRHPREDLLTALVQAESEGDRLTEEELLITAGQLFAAGFETTTHLLGNGLAALVEHPDQQDLLRRSGTELAGPAAEEVLRYDSAVQIGLRTALADTDVDGVPVRRGERIVCYLGAANRDPGRFRDPERFDISRADNASMSFGGGIHYCLGASLARLETEIAFPAILARYDDITFAGQPERRDSLTLRGYLSLPLTFSPSGG